MNFNVNPSEFTPVSSNNITTTDIETGTNIGWGKHGIELRTTFKGLNRLISLNAAAATTAIKTCLAWSHQRIISESFQSLLASSRLRVAMPDRQKPPLMHNVNHRGAYITTYIKES